MTRDTAPIHIEYPYNLSAEAAVLGAVLFDNVVIDLLDGKLRPQDFHQPINQDIFERCLTLHRQGKVADGVTLREWFDREVKDFDSANEYLADLLDAAALGPEVQDYASMIYDMSVRRQLIRSSVGNIERAMSEGGEDALASAQKDLTAIEDSWVSGSNWAMAALDAAIEFDVIKDAVMNGKQHELRGETTGVEPIDDLIGGGLHAGDLIVLAGRPGMGKTALAANIANQVAGNGTEGNDNVVGFFHLEMSKQQNSQRMTSSFAQLIGEGRIEYRDIRSGNIGQNQLAILLEGVSAIPQGLMMDYSDSLTVDQVIMRTRALKRNYGERLKLIVIDYLQLMKIQKSKHSQYTNTNDGIGEITRSLKGLAKSEGITIILLSQLSRKCETRDNKRPIISDLRDSGNIEQDADIVLFVYRHEYYLEKAEPDGFGSPNWNAWYADMADCKNKMEVIAGKVRMSKATKCTVHFDAGTGTVVAKQEQLDERVGLGV